MAGRPTAPERMRRVLAVVPWITANPGRTVSEVATRFGLTEKELLDDLNVVFMVGLPPYSPDALIDVQIDEEGRVWIDLADYFSKPLRLTPSQGLALLASSDALLSMPGTDGDGALARALDKLGQALGVGPGGALDIHLGDAEATVLGQLRSAAAAGYEAEIRYYSYGRDERTDRRIAPWRVFADGGSWYVHGWCHRAEGERVFRVDRIESITVVPEPSDQLPPDDHEAQVFQPRDDHPRVTVRLTPEAAWVVDAYPTTVLETDADGLPSLVELVVTATPWLERLLVRVGPEAEVVEASGLDDAAGIAATAAGRILARYRSSA